jgi:hypothetical protein
MHALVVASTRQVGCEVGGEAVLLHLERGVYYGLNAVGARVWQLLQSPLTLSAIVEQVELEFEVEHERCINDIQELVAKLARADLVEIRESLRT